jgi:hypothetical protein
VEEKNLEAKKAERKKVDAKVAEKNLAKINKKYVHFVFEVDIYNSIKLKSYSVSLVN